MELSFQRTYIGGTFAPWYCRSLELLLPGTLVPWDFCLLELSYPGTVAPNSEKWHGTFAPLVQILMLRVKSS